MDSLQSIVSRFALRGEIESIAPFGGGHINDTYRITTSSAETPDYILQRINHAIFRDVETMQRNIVRITEHIRHHLAERGEKDLSRKALTVVPTRDGALFLKEGDTYWRMTELIPDSVTLYEVTPETAYLTGRGFGDFQQMLSDLPGEPLGATIPDFHNMELRIQQLKDAVQANPVGRVGKARPLVDALMKRADEMCMVERLHREGSFPKRIAHCDTKVDNMLFDRSTGDFLCVIDLDTTMPGYVLSDFGDFIRTAGNTGAEDEPDLEKVGLNMDIFRAFARGYLETASPFLTPIEKAMLPFGARMMTYMQTVRFLTDYLNGDTYYKTAFPEHNWQRSWAQFTLLQSLERHNAEMMRCIRTLSQEKSE